MEQQCPSSERSAAPVTPLKNLEYRHIPRLARLDGFQSEANKYFRVDILFPYALHTSSCPTHYTRLCASLNVNYKHLVAYPIMRDSIQATNRRV